MSTLWGALRCFFSPGTWSKRGRSETKLKRFGTVGSACLTLANTLKGSTSSTNCTRNSYLAVISDVDLYVKSNSQVNATFYMHYLVTIL